MVSTAPVADSVERPRHRLGRRSHRERLAIRGIAAAGALAAAFAPAHPTGLRGIDIVWCAALGLLVTLAASRSRRWAWMWLAGLATAGAVGSSWVWAGALGLGLALFGAFHPRRNRVLGAAIGALAVQALLRMPAVGFHGLPSLIAVLAIAPALWSAYDRSPRSDRRWIRRGMLVAGTVAVVALLGLGVAVATARAQLQRGVDSAHSGLDAVRDGDQTLGTARFDDAAGSFSEARTQLSAVWALPARALPVVSQQVEALIGVANSGSSLAGTASVAAGTAPYKDLRASAGQLDLAKVASMQAPVAASADALQIAQDDIATVSSPWLLPPVAEPIASFSADIDRTLPEARLAAEGLAVTPTMLGAEGPRHYLILFTTPAETRFLGGFTGAYGILTADNGKVTLSRSGKIAELSNAPGADQRTLNDHPEFLERYGRYTPTQFFQNVTASPDLPTDASVARDLYHQITGVDVDGVMVADPYAIASLLQLTGPVTVDGLSEPLTTENAAQYLLVDQYLDFDAASDARNDRLGDAARATFDALTERDLPGPKTLGDALGPAMRQGRLLFSAFDPAEETFLDHLGSTGRFHPSAGADYISVRTANTNPNKIDTFLQRSIDYAATYNPESGAIDATATVSLTNTAPTEGLPPYVIGNDRGEAPGTNTMYLSFYTPLQLTRATLSDGNTSSPEDAATVGVEPQHELGSNVYSLLVSVPAGSTVTLRFELTGSIAAGADYDLDVLNQPMAHDDQLTIAIGGASPTRTLSSTEGLEMTDGRARSNGRISENEQLSATFGG